jgi:hypothetical protein
MTTAERRLRLITFILLRRCAEFLNWVDPPKFFSKNFGGLTEFKREYIIRTLEDCTLKFKKL